MAAVKRYDGKWECQTRVFSGERCDMRGHWCRRQANSDPDENGNPTKCRTHSKEGQRKLQEKRDQKYREWERRLQRRINAAEARESAVEIVKKIADGYNDPRALCLKWREDFE